MKVKVAIVILNWNGRRYLEQFLPSVLASTYKDYTLIIADNASTDDSVIFLQKNYPSVGIIQLTQNFGFAKGYNEALKQVDAEYYVLLNSDVEVEPGWIEPIMQLMESDRTIAACQPKILMHTDKSRFEYAGAAGGWIDSFGYPFARGRVFDYCEKDEGQYDNTQSVFWASGAAMFVRSALYQQLGGLDNYFFAHQEEIDLCWRLQLAGYKIMACPASVVYHVGGGTMPKGNERKIFLNFRNNLIMLSKNLPLSAALWKIPFRILLDIISAYKSLFSGNVIYFKAVAKAHAGFIKWRLFYRNKSNYSGNRKAKLTGWYAHSIIWDHFIKGKKTFKEIIGDKA